MSLINHKLIIVPELKFFDESQKEVSLGVKVIPKLFGLEKIIKTPFNYQSLYFRRMKNHKIFEFRVHCSHYDCITVKEEDIFEAYRNARAFKVSFVNSKYKRIEFFIPYTYMQWMIENKNDVVLDADDHCTANKENPFEIVFNKDMATLGHLDWNQIEYRSFERPSNSNDLWYS